MPTARLTDLGLLMHETLSLALFPSAAPLLRYEALLCASVPLCILPAPSHGSLMTCLPKRHLTQIRGYIHNAQSQRWKLVLRPTCHGVLQGRAAGLRDSGLHRRLPLRALRAQRRPAGLHHAGAPRKLSFLLRIIIIIIISSSSSSSSSGPDVLWFWCLH